MLIWIIISFNAGGGWHDGTWMLSNSPCRVSDVCISLFFETTRNIKVIPFVWAETAPIESNRLDLNQIDSNWFESCRIESNWIESNWIESYLIELNRTGIQYMKQVSRTKLDIQYVKTVSKQKLDIQPLSSRPLQAMANDLRWPERVDCWQEMSVHVRKRPPVVDLLFHFPADAQRHIFHTTSMLRVFPYPSLSVSFSLSFSLYLELSWS